MNTGASGLFIVDDDLEDHMIIEDAIRSLDAQQVLYFEPDGIAALNRLEALHKEGSSVSLFIVDLNMPKMGGLEFLSHLKNDDRFKAIPVIIYSTSVNPLEKENCLRLGASNYLTKPVTFQQSLDAGKLFLEIAKETVES